MEMNYNYHTHTFRSHHASGTPEEYVLRAIENGVKYMGFSDHVPMLFDDGKQSGHRIPIEQGKVYVDEIKALAKKYKKQIDIKVGFEVEYYTKYFNKVLNDAIEWGADYMILGPHFYAPENEGNAHACTCTADVMHIKEYVNNIISAMSEGVFTYIAHPDMLNFVGDDEIYNREIERMCKASKMYKVPLEINFLGIRDSRNYPTEKFWNIAGKVGCPVTFGFDAHDVKAAFDDESLIKAKEMVEKFNLNYIGRPKILPLKKGVIIDH